MEQHRLFEEKRRKKFRREKKWGKEIPNLIQNDAPLCHPIGVMGSEKWGKTAIKRNRKE